MQRTDRLDYVIKRWDRLRPNGLPAWPCVLIVTLHVLVKLVCRDSTAEIVTRPALAPGRRTAASNHAVGAALMMSPSRPDRPGRSPRAEKGSRSPMGQRVSIVQYCVLHKLRSSCLQAVPTGILRGWWAAWLGWILEVTIHTTHLSRIEWQPAPSPAPAGLERGLLKARSTPDSARRSRRGRGD